MRTDIKYTELPMDKVRKVRRFICKEYGVNTLEEIFYWANMPGNTYDEDGNLYIHGEKY